MIKLETQEKTDFSYEEILEVFFLNRKAGFHVTYSQHGFFHDDENYVKTEINDKTVFVRFADVKKDNQASIYFQTEEEFKENGKDKEILKEKLHQAILTDFSLDEAVRIIGGAFGDITYFKYKFFREIKKKRGICHLDKSPNWNKCSHIKNEWEVRRLQSQGMDFSCCNEGWPPYYKERIYEIITTSGERQKAMVDDSREFFSEGLEWKSLDTGRNIEKDAVIAWKEICEQNNFIEK